MPVVLDIVSWLFISTGAFFIIVGALGVLRFPDFYTRLHAVSVCDTIGAGLLLTGLMFQAGLTLVTVKLLLILYFMVFTGPTSTHILAEAALQGRLEPLTKDSQA